MRKSLVLLLMVGIIFAGCQSKEIISTETMLVDVTASVDPTIVKVLPTETPIPPTNTPAPPTLTPTETFTSTSTFTPTPSADFENLQILGGKYNGEGVDSIIYIAFPRVDKDYKYVMDYREYSCAIDTEIPDRVNCFGKYLDSKISKSVIVQIFDLESSDLLFENEVYVPMTKPTPIPCGPFEGCPVRGINMTCETEWRQEGDEICVVMSCFDSCGYCSSLHTCKTNPEGHNAIIAPTPTPY